MFRKIQLALNASYITYKILLFGLLFLVSLTAIFISPGVANFELFTIFFQRLNLADFWSLFSIYIQYPPGVSSILSFIAYKFPTDPTNPYFFTQTPWFIQKFLLYTAYIFTWLAILYLNKITQVSPKLSDLDVSIAYFASFPILLISVALTYFDILAAPFLILSLAFLFRNRFLQAAFFYSIAIVFNWTLLVFSPLFYLYWLQAKKQRKLEKLLFRGLIATLVLLLVTYGAAAVSPKNARILLDILSDTKILIGVLRHTNELLSFLLPRAESLNLWVLLGPSMASVVAIVSTGLLLTRILKRLSLPKKLAYLIPLIAIAAVALSQINFIFLFFAVLFLIVYFRILQTLESQNITSAFSFILGSLATYLVFLLLFPTLFAGNLLWVVLLGLILFILDRSDFSRILLIAANILVFVAIYLFFGTDGKPPVRGLFYETLRNLLSVSSIIFTVWLVSLLHKHRFSAKITLKKVSGPAVKWMKVFTIAFILLLGISHLPAVGDPDGGNWITYTSALVKYGNPFYAHVAVKQYYAPFSTFLFGFWGLLGNFFFGPNLNYLIAARVGILVFLLITVTLLVSRWVSQFSQKKLGLLDKLFVIATVFILTQQTQGMGDINIWLIPFIIASIIALYRDKFFLSGVLIATATSIKWQSMILLPLFAVGVFHFQDKFKRVIKNSILFNLGFWPVIIIPELLVIMQPGGREFIEETFNLYFRGGIYLSGLALNLNWIVSWLYGIFDPIRAGYSVAENSGLTYVVPYTQGHFIFKGILFEIITLIIVLRFWLFQRKNIVNFTSAAIMIFFSHYALNISAMNLHFFYQAVLMLFLYLINPTPGNRMLLGMFDLMAIMSNALSYGFTGDAVFNRSFFGFDITIAYSLWYMLIYFWILWIYLRGGTLLEKSRAFAYEDSVSKWFSGFSRNYLTRKS